MRRRLMMLCASVLALSAVAGGIAIAAGKKTAKANIQQGNNHCGANETADPVMGTAFYKRSGETVSVKITLKNGAPNATYGTALYGNGCTGLSSGTNFTTNKKGIGKDFSTFTVPPGDTEFFVTIYEVTGSGFGVDNNTPYVTLAP